MDAQHVRRRRRGDSGEVVTTCPDCTRPLATDDSPDDDSVCWREYHSGVCLKPIDWCARCLAAEQIITNYFAAEERVEANARAKVQHELDELKRLLDVEGRLRQKAETDRNDAQYHAENMQYELFATEDERKAARFLAAGWRRLAGKMRGLGLAACNEAKDAITRACRVHRRAQRLEGIEARVQSIRDGMLTAWRVRDASYDETKKRLAADAARLVSIIAAWREAWEANGAEEDAFQVEDADAWTASCKRLSNALSALRALGEEV